MVELRPLVLDDYGLIAALRWYGQQYAQRTGIDINVQGEDLDPPLPDSMEIAIFRIAQEALNNVAKHAKADRVTIVAKEKNGNIRVMISDNGQGFSPTLKKTQNMGILTMRERAIGCSAQFKIKSNPGEGTTITLDIKR